MNRFSNSFQEGSSQVGPIVYSNTCAATQSASSVLLGDTSAVVSWTDPIVIGVNYSIEYRVLDTPNWTIAGQTSSHNYQIDNLAEGTIFEFRVQKICGTDVYSPYTAAGSIITSFPPCVSVTNLVVTPSSFSASATWNPVSNATDYKVYLNNILKATVTTTNYTFTGLDDNTVYTVKIETQCPGSDIDPSTSINFSTVPFICNATNNLQLSGTASTLTAFWNPVSDATGYAYSINNGQYINTINPGFTINVNPNTIYNVSVITYCQNNKVSLPTSGSFTTPSGCNNVTDFIASVIYPSGIPDLSLTWTPATGASNYLIYIDNTLVDTINSGIASSWDSNQHSIVLPTGTHTVKLVTKCGNVNTSGVTSNFTVDVCSPVTNAVMIITPI